MDRRADERSVPVRRIGVIHRSHLLRQGLVRILSEGRFEVIWQGADGAEALNALETDPPDVILVEWEAPGVSAALVERLAGSSHAVPVVLLTQPDFADGLSVVLEAGAAGCLSANLDEADFLSSLRILAHGDILVSHELVPAVSSDSGDGSRLLDRLTSRELEILKALARGATNQEIGEQLAISQNTVKIHVRNLLTKMGLRNRQQAAAFAATEGLL